MMYLYMSKQLPEIMKTVTPSPSKTMSSIKKSIPTKSLSESITGKTIKTPSFSSQSFPKTVESSNQGIYIAKIILIGLILSLLGYNLYIYLVNILVYLYGRIKRKIFETIVHLKQVM